jgi:hypothetical protein
MREDNPWSRSVDQDTIPMYAKETLFSTNDGKRNESWSAVVREEARLMFKEEAEGRKRFLFISSFFFPLLRSRKTVFVPSHPSLELPPLFPLNRC